jgi:serralysin
MRIHRLAFASVLLLGAACAGEVTETEPLTYEEFRAQAYQEPESGVFIVNGDEMAETEGLLQEAYDRYLQSVDTSGIGSSQHESIVNLVNGQWDRWSSSQAQNLTYCITASGKGSFSSARYNAVVNAMNTATGAWEAAGRVNFIHDASQDGNCNSRNSNVVFNVSQVCRGQYLARAFFPSSSRRSREVLIDCTSFGNIDPWTLAGVLRHELGHTIGLRHEHTRPESGTCFEDNNWAALTAYDSSSVMHYPQCNGTQKGDLVLTSMDKTGAATLYP